MIGYVGDIISWNGSRKWNGSLDVEVNGIIVKAKSFCNSSLVFFLVDGCWLVVVEVAIIWICFVRSFFDGFLDAASIKYRKCECVFVWEASETQKQKQNSITMKYLWNFHLLFLYILFLFQIRIMNNMHELDFVSP